MALWRRLALGREEYLQRLITTLIAGGDPPPWNTPRPPSERGSRFLRLLDDAAHADGSRQTAEPEVFVDEFLLPKLEETAQNGWPDWAALWQDRIWIIELKTEAASHRDDQLPYYLRLATTAHPPMRERTATDDLLSLARSTAADGRQRAVGATSPTELEALRDTARARIDQLPSDDATRFVLPWLWRANRTDGRALTSEGEEFGYELRFSRYKKVQVRP